MKNNNKFLSPIACAFLLSSSVVYGGDGCRTVSGVINTQSLPDGISQVGTVEISYDGTGKAETCAIYGQLTGPATLAHLIVCKNGATITTTDDVYINLAPIAFCDDGAGVILEVEETSLVTGGSKKYVDASGGFISSGTLNTCTGMNSLTFNEGELCLSEGEQ